MIGSKKWTTFKTTLLAIQDDLKGRPWDLSDIRVQPSADELDAALGAADRELAIVHWNRTSATLREVRAALCRIEGGSYGVCLDCDREIGKRRLQAVPWAPVCVPCQEARDRGEGGGRSAAAEVEVEEAA